MYTLGISALYHDSAAALLKDGTVIAALEEERFSRVKHDNDFPVNAVRRCLEMANISIQDIESITYYEKPLLKFERILEMWVDTYPRSVRPFVKALPEWLHTKINVERIIRDKLAYDGPIHYADHHRSHAAATYFTSPFTESAVLTLDGVGEYETTSLWHAHGKEMQKIASLHFPHSLGLLYSTFTAFLGFSVNNDEYKVMGLAAYGEPKYKETIYRLLDVKEDGSFALNMRYFSFRESFRMWNRRFEKLFGAPRPANAALEQHHKDIAASIQAVTEERYFAMLDYLHAQTGTKNLCVSGGVALNSLANGKITKHTPFEQIHIMGAAGDGGSAIGSALAAHHVHNATKNKKETLPHLLLGTSYEYDEIESALQQQDCRYRRARSDEELIEHAATRLTAGHIIGWFQGRMEFGPRSLGARSILADPRSAEMKDRTNQVKQREAFRPFAASIRLQDVATYFDVPEKLQVPFMNFCFTARPEKRDDIAAVVHADHTTRIQTVTREQSLFYDLLSTFKHKTGIPALLNTSFNIKGQPIVEHPAQAVETFKQNPIDYLYIGHFIVWKE